MQYIKQLKSNRKSKITNQFLKLGLGLILLVGLASLFSCEDFVEAELPNSQINGETVFENTGTATVAMTYIYAQLRDNVLIHGKPNGIEFLLGHYTDEMDLFSTSLQNVDFFYKHTVLPSDATVSSLWSGAYNLIYASNAVIEGLDNSVSIPQGEKDQLMGEALFARAFIHFYLVNLFGDVPYVTTTNYQENTQASKIPIVQVHENIILDLLEAKDLLPDTYFSIERTRPNKGVASALLSRVYLFTQDWDNAQAESTSLITNTGLYALENDLAKVFLKESTSTIWQFKPSATADTNNTLEGFFFIFDVGPPPIAALSSTFITAFEPGDNRFTNWVGSATDAGMTDTWYYPFKYKEGNSTEPSKEFTILFRLAEQYLIRAEARAHLGNIIGAQQDLNIIRIRAGLGNTSANTMNDLLDAILQERQVELFTEFGHRFFDLKRTGKADAVLSPVKPGWEPKDVLLPIPEQELLVNPNLLPQNDGY